MSENTCPNVALSRNQNLWVVKESADKTLEFPAVTDIINVTADVFANQEIPTSDNREKANTLNKLNVFNSSASPATANFGMYLRPTALDAPMQGTHSCRRFRASWRHPSPEPLPTPSRTATRSLSSP